MLFLKKSQASKVVIYVVKDLENRSIIILFQTKTDKTKKFNLIFSSRQFKTDVFSYECTNLFNLKHVSVCMPNISYIGF